ncbi:hypothetical protein BGX29_002919 [Mortierella sp. GBA35]|nr:hypothetical protein BGX23_011516 [Mortierella sp. AD031]KAF9103783.1 hypothetical protein BGX29_002919 [Mortierella sp. GBA35]KAG0219287.1 hypothetical protein BGX33_003834 [Mortierella sp. NVP41]
MRLIQQRADDAAATEAMRGGAIGAIKYCTVALFAGGVLTAVSPKFAAIKPPQKMWLFVAAFLGGFGNGSDTTFTNFERRDRELQIRIAEQKRHDILYGPADEHKPSVVAAAAALSNPTASSTPAAATA